MISYRIKGMYFATNNVGEGLFIWDKNPYTNSWEWHKLLGSCDFKISNVKHPRAKIIRQLKAGNYFGSWSEERIKEAFENRR